MFGPLTALVYCAQVSVSLLRCWQPLSVSLLRCGLGGAFKLSGSVNLVSVMLASIYITYNLNAFTQTPVVLPLHIAHKALVAPSGSARRTPFPAFCHRDMCMLQTRNRLLVPQVIV